MKPAYTFEPGNVAVSIGGQEFVTVRKGVSVGPTTAILANAAVAAPVAEVVPTRQPVRVVVSGLSRTEHRARTRRLEKLNAKYRAGKITAMQLAEALHAMGLGPVAVSDAQPRKS